MLFRPIFVISMLLQSSCLLAMDSLEKDSIPKAVQRVKKAKSGRDALVKVLKETDDFNQQILERREAQLAQAIELSQRFYQTLKLKSDELEKYKKLLTSLLPPKVLEQALSIPSSDRQTGHSGSQLQELSKRTFAPFRPLSNSPKESKAPNTDSPKPMELDKETASVTSTTSSSGSRSKSGSRNSSQPSSPTVSPGPQKKKARPTSAQSTSGSNSGSGYQTPPKNKGVKPVKNNKTDEKARLDAKARRKLAFNYGIKLRRTRREPTSKKHELRAHYEESATSLKPMKINVETPSVASTASSGGSKSRSSSPDTSPGLQKKKPRPSSSPSTSGSGSSSSPQTSQRNKDRKKQVNPSNDKGRPVKASMAEKKKRKEAHARSNKESFCYLDRSKLHVHYEVWRHHELLLRNKS
jgi:hypothetical protein